MTLYLRNLSVQITASLVMNHTTSSTPTEATTKSAGISFSDRVLLTLLYSIVGVLGLILCILLFYTILRNKPLRTRPNILLLDLLISDILFILLQLPYGIYTTLLEPPENSHAIDGFCTGFLLLSYAFVITNIIALSVISVDRYLSVAHPYFYHKYLHQKYFIFILLWPWVQSLTVCLPIAFHEDWVAYDKLSDSFCAIQWSTISMPYVISLVIAVVLLPLVILFITNSRVHRIARQHAYKASRVCPFLPSDKEETRCQRASTIRSTASSVMPMEDINENKSNWLAPDTKSYHEPDATSKKHDEASENQYLAISNNFTDKVTKPTRKMACSLQSLTVISDEAVMNIAGNSEVYNNAAVGARGEKTRRSFVASVRQRVSVINVNGLSKIPRPETIAKCKLQIRIALSTYFLIASFILCWFPFLIPRILQVCGFSFPEYVGLYTAVSPTFISLFDPIVILFTRREIKNSVVLPSWRRRHKMIQMDLRK